MILICAAIQNALSVKKEYFWEAFLDTFLLDQFSNAHRYFKKGK